MKNKKLNKGKKLDRNTLHTINGGSGSVRCTNSSGYCVYIGPGCAEQECQLPEPLDPVG
ncbi:ComC/BlpC family leader-containing pheromone/bacteriocin [Chryseobacterium sp.]|uniref:ComC/BlpC family leader-containing pheromone/bacteriocin n=1 Tax=Chryseobacterium sp. TaxID=1871047 RepID=UPI001B283854|nr:ComC/BlpC family leader-containing pheromone/bacteriocin [Chryseobacterium sp.]MBO9690779.1 ComC/BlpC family leader-containing pheromone/bacteriocin [Chryseobacterium sp.]